jgi:HAAS
MTTDTDADRLVADYLARLERAAARVPAGRREELLAEIDGHIRSARASGDADVRTLLDRLGTPEEIAAAAEDAPAPGAVRRPTAALEIAAFAMLTFGSFLPGVGWLLGLVLLWSSRRWRLGEKLLATLVVPGGPGLLPLIALVVPAQTCVSTDGGPTTCTGFAFAPAVGIPLFIVSLVGPFVLGGVLLHRAVVRAAAEPPIPVRPWWGRREVAAVLLLGPGGLFLPLAGPAIGLVFAWTAARWSRLDKSVATVIALLPAVVVGVAGASGLALPGLLAWPAALLPGPVVAAVYLAVTLDRS